MKYKEDTGVKNIVEDLKEIAPCRMKISYTVNSDDFITYTDINDRSEGKLQKACDRCTWRGLCNPTAMSKETLLAELAEIQKKAADLAKYAEVIFSQGAEEIPAPLGTRCRN